MIASRNEFPSLIESLGLTGVGVEVGTAAGDFARVLLQSQLAQVIAVDNWCNPLEHENRRRAHELASEHDRFSIVEMDSDQAARRFDDGSLDFVYIDAMHEYRYVSRDLAAWWPKIRTGGVLAGHDYTTWNAAAKCECGVVLAVEELATRERRQIRVTGCESGRYLDRLAAAHLSQEIPSFWIVK